MKGSFFRRVLGLCVVALLSAGTMICAPGVFAQDLAEPLPLYPASPPTFDVLLIPTTAANSSQRDRLMHQKFAWRAAARESFYFLMVENGYRLAQSKTRRELGGPFFRDWKDSVAGIHGWGDGDSIVTNYVGHPMEGAIAGLIEIQNDPVGRSLEFSGSGRYWKSRLRATLWAALFSTQFEIGPISEASVGNVGKRKGTAGLVDFVVTPAGGAGLIVLEDVLDRYVVEKLEERTDSARKRAFYRMVMNPDRTFTNLLAGKAPWYRYARPLSPVR